MRVSREVLEQMVEEARRASPQECCGLLAGRHGEITTAFSARNTLSSPSAYEIAPEELFRIFRQMHAAGLEHLGIYHSHPAGSNMPSRRDIECAYYPKAAYFIISPAEELPAAVRAFSIRDGEVTELVVEPV